MFHGTRSAYAKGRLCISIKSRIGYCRAGPRRLAGASTFELRLTSLSLTTHASRARIGDPSHCGHGGHSSRRLPSSLPLDLHRYRHPSAALTDRDAHAVGGGNERSGVSRESTLQRNVCAIPHPDSRILPEAGVVDLAADREVVVAQVDLIATNDEATPVDLVQLLPSARGSHLPPTGRGLEKRPWSILIAFVVRLLSHCELRWQNL